jgi:sortase A
LLTLPGDLVIEIPSLDLREEIVGIPLGSEGWDVTWLGGRVGYLQSSAFPTTPGNSVITGHVYLSNGLPGPFERLRDLQWGDQVFIDAWGQRYVYEVRQVTTVGSADRSAFRHEELPWLTLVTCQDFDEARDSYRHRLLVRAVLMDVAEAP